MSGIRRSAADEWFSKAVRHRDGNACVYCQRSEGQIDSAHIWGRRIRSTRWLPDNCLALCRHHHQWFTERPVEFKRFLEIHLGQGMLDLLQERANNPMKIPRAEEKAIAKHYREELRRMEAAGTRDLVSYY